LCCKSLLSNTESPIPYLPSPFDSISVLLTYLILPYLTLQGDDDGVEMTHDEEEEEEEENEAEAEEQAAKEAPAGHEEVTDAVAEKVAEHGAVKEDVKGGKSG
jgi:hypothetical protein